MYIEYVSHFSYVVQWVRFLKKLAWSGVGSTGFLIYMPFLRNPPLRGWAKWGFLGVFGGGGFGVLPSVLPGGLRSAGAEAAVGSNSFLGVLSFSGPANPVKVSYYKVSYLRDPTVSISCLTYYIILYYSIV